MRGCIERGRIILTAAAGRCSQKNNHTHTHAQFQFDTAVYTAGGHLQTGICKQADRLKPGALTPERSKQRYYSDRSGCDPKLRRQSSSSLFLQWMGLCAYFSPFTSIHRSALLGGGGQPRKPSRALSHRRLLRETVCTRDVAAACAHLSTRFRRNNACPAGGREGGRRYVRRQSHFRVSTQKTWKQTTGAVITARPTRRASTCGTIAHARSAQLCNTTTRRGALPTETRTHLLHRKIRTSTVFLKWTKSSQFLPCKRTTETSARKTMYYAAT